MPRPLTEREPRRRRHRRRKRIVLSIFFLLLVLIVILIVSLTQLTVGLVQDCIWYQPKETPTGTTTTTYPTLDYASVDSVLNMYSAILYDATHDTILFEKNPNDVVYPASLTKMLTAIVACEFCPTTPPLLLVMSRNWSPGMPVPPICNPTLLTQKKKCCKHSYYHPVPMPPIALPPMWQRSMRIICRWTVNKPLTPLLGI